MEIYQDSSRSAGERAKDLLSKMSLEEKINQLECYLLTNPDSEVMEKETQNGIGSIGMMNAGRTSREVSENISRIQQMVMRHSRFGIPALFHVEALAGPGAPGCADFPLSITNAASFNGENVKRMTQITREQMKALGIRMALSPVLDIARDLRYGRIGETFGGDPTLVSEMSCAFVSGLQGDDLSQGVAATAKHFLGCAQVEAGINQTRAVADERELEEVFAKPFEAAIRNCGLKSVMNSYGEANGEPFCASSRYLRGLLRGKLGFDGVVVSDYHSIDRLIQPFYVAKDKEDAAAMAINGGMDMEFPSRFIYSGMEQALRDGKVTEETLNESVYRVLKLKFELGLFEAPLPVFEEKLFDNAQYDDVIRRTTEESITLLKNEGVLPLTDKSVKIGVIGQPGDSLRHLYGAYTAPVTTEMVMDLMSDAGTVGMAGVKMETVNEENALNDEKRRRLFQEQCPGAKTILEALREQYESVSYAEGYPVGICDSMEQIDFDEAKKLAAESEVLVVCVGGKNGVGKKCTSGEGIDSTQVELPGGQEELVKQLYAINPNMIVVHTDAKPLVSRFIYDNAPAIIEGWLPCRFGGQVIADVISGDVNPSGHLPMDIPKSTGQMPYYYSQRNASSMDSIRSCVGDFIVNQDGYIDAKREAELPFGYGLSYTEFSYSDMVLLVSQNGAYRVEVDVKNTGERDGSAVVQLYGKDEIASVVRPYKELLGVCRVNLKAGECARIFFSGNLNQFAFENLAGKYCVEAGTFRFEIASDSRTPVLERVYEQPETLEVNWRDRVYYAQSGRMEN